jgi:hypothetical protein
MENQNPSPIDVSTPGACPVEFTTFDLVVVLPSGQWMEKGLRVEEIRSPTLSDRSGCRERMPLAELLVDT